MELIWELRCPACQRSMIAGHLLDAVLDSARRRPASVRDRVAARIVAEEFGKLGGKPAERVSGLVDRYWNSYPRSERRELAQVLLVILSWPVDRGAGGPTAVDECEMAVVDWIDKVRFAAV